MLPNSLERTTIVTLCLDHQRGAATIRSRFARLLLVLAEAKLDGVEFVPP